MLALDTETDATHAQRLVVVSLAWGPSVRDTELLHHSDPATERIVSEALAMGPVALANAPFDLAVLVERYPDIEPLVWSALERLPELDFRSPGDVRDVLTREKLLDLAKGRGLKRKYSLAEVADRRLGVTLAKKDTWRKRYGELIDIPLQGAGGGWPPDAEEYARLDACTTYALAEAQDNSNGRFQAENELDVFVDAPRQARAHWALHLSALHGVCTDPAAVAALDRKLELELRRCLDVLVPHGLARSNGTRNTVAAAELAARCGATQMTAGGTKPRKDGSFAPQTVSLNEEALARLDLALDHPLKVYQKYGSILGLRSRELKRLRQPVIHTRYNELVENGRTSSSGSRDEDTKEVTGKNLQNFPRGDNEWERGFRECLVPREGYIFVGCDWSKMELSTTAQVLITLFGWDAPTSKLAQVILEGRDPHTELGLRIAERLKERIAAGLLTLPAGLTPEKQGRQIAKPFNFGKWGGMGNDCFRDYARGQGVVLTPDETQDYSQQWAHLWYPWPYFDWVNNHAKDGIVQFVSDRVRGGTSYTDACNGVWSGLAADIAKDTLWRLAKEIYGAPGCEGSDLYDCRQVLFVHDENVLEVPLGREEKAAARLKLLMEETFSRWCLDVPCKAEVTIMERYRKG